MRSATVALGAASLGKSILLRRAALRCARLGCGIRNWLKSGWRPLALVYVLAAAIIILHRRFTGTTPALRSVSLRWFFRAAAGPWLQSAGLAALIVAVSAGYRARKRIVIVGFTNLTGDDSKKTIAESLPRRLMTQLSEIAEVHSDVGDDPADLSLDKPGEAPALSVDSAMSALEGLTASLKDQKVSLGFVSVPLGGMLSTLSAFVQGPRIVGSLQATAQGLLLEASISGGGLEQTWRVRECDVEPAPGTTNGGITDEMIRQLAWRMFTWLEHDALGTSVWRAAQHYTEALRAFREANREKAGTSRRILALQQAQKGFFLAYREDSRFTRSRYNLGVIGYSDGQYRTAYEIFRAVIDDPDRARARGAPWTPQFQRARHDLAGAHDAAAKAAQNLGSSWRDRVLYHCDMALTLIPAHTQAWNLVGLTTFPDPGSATYSDDGYAGTEPYFRTAVSLSWRELCASEWAGKRSIVLLSRAVLQLANLAESHVCHKRSLGEMNQALYLDPSNAFNRVEMGKLCLAAGEKEHAAAAFAAANRERECALHCLWLACTVRLLNPNAPAGDRWGDPWKLVQNATADDLFIGNGIEKFWGALDVVLRLGKIAFDFSDWKTETRGIARRATQIRTAGEDVAAGRITPADAVAVLDPPKTDPPDPKTRVEWLVERRDVSGEARLLLPFVVRRLLEDLAVEAQAVRLKPENFAIAPALVVKAMEAKPTGALERSLMARLYLLLQLPELAEGEVRNALILEPANDDLKVLFVNAALAVFNTVTDKTVRTQALRRIVSVFRDLADVENGKLRAQDSVGVAGWAHFHLAWFSYELRDFKTAQKSYETSFACRYKPLESLSALSLVHFRCGAVEEAEQAYVRMKTLIAEIKQAGEPPKAPDTRTPAELAWAEDKASALLLAAAANNTAGARALIGLTAPAFSRWKEGRNWTRKAPGLSTDDRQRILAAQSFCLGLIRLSAAASLTAASESTGRKIRMHRVAIRLFVRTIELAVDPANRAEASYYMGTACAGLVTLDPAGADLWRSRASTALQNADNADRRGEFQDRIQQLRSTVDRPPASVASGTSAKSP